MKLWYYYGYPHTGGTYSVFRSLREGLSKHGIEVKWLGIGNEAVQAYQSSPDQSSGYALASEGLSAKEQARAMNDFIASQGAEGVFVNVLSSKVQTNSIRYLDPSVKRVMIVHNITPGTYAAAKSVRDHVHFSVGVSPRIHKDLIRKHGFNAGQITFIPNAIDIDAFQAVSKSSQRQPPIRLLYLGRIIDIDKGVFWLPEILQRLEPDSYHLSIVGDGPDLQELKKRCAPFESGVSFLGRVSPSEVPGAMAAHDVLLFTSRFEGLGLSLVEAMAAGCVPVASRLRDVTDYVVDDGNTGLLFEVGDVNAAATLVRSLIANPDRLASLSNAARMQTADRFNLIAMAQAYAEVLNGLELNDLPIERTLPVEKWGYPRGLKPGLRTYLPSGLKNRLRVLKERLAL